MIKSQVVKALSTLVLLVAMRKLKLKVDADGNKTSQVHGIRAACKVMKTRYSKPFESVQVEIPYETGMSPYSGLVEFFEAKGLLIKQGNRLKYVTKAGEEMIEFRKNWTDEKLDIVMNDWNAEDIEDVLEVETEDTVASEEA